MVPLQSTSLGMISPRLPPVQQCDYYQFRLSAGLDVPRHGEPAYPLASYGDGWGGDGSSDMIGNPAVILKNRASVNNNSSRIETTDIT